MIEVQENGQSGCGGVLVHPTYGLSQSHSQRLAMTQGLRQAITVLQMSTEEMWEYVRGEVAANPLLEWAVDPPALEVSYSEAGDFWDATVLYRVSDSAGVFAEGVPGDRISADRPVARESGAGGSLLRGRERGIGRVRDFAETAVAEDDTLKSTLHVQADLDADDLGLRRVIHYLIESLDVHGYLPCTAGDIAGELGVPTQAVEAALVRLQTYEPRGVGARDLRECLLIQLQDVEGADAERARLLVGERLEDLAARRMGPLARWLRCSTQDVERAFDLIQRLDPRPGSQYKEGQAPYIVPDLLVVASGQGFTVVQNEDALPRLRIGDPALLRGGKPGGPGDAVESGEVQSYLARRLSEARELIRALEARETTLLRVARTVVSRQTEFLVEGPTGLRPYTLRDAAEELGLHESTVSRAVAGKFVETPHGIFELRYFFGSGGTGAAAGGESVAAAGIRARIRRLIEAEDPRAPLCDRDLAERLAAAGISVSRRTVAKYREEMFIPGSSRRRRPHAQEGSEGSRGADGAPGIGGSRGSDALNGEPVRTLGQVEDRG